MADKNRVEIYDKIWVASLDDKTRPSHRAAHGQRVPFSEKFSVGGVLLDGPGDPEAPLEETARCRCHMRVVQRGVSLTAGSSPEQEIEMATKSTTTLANETETEQEVETFQTFTAVAARFGEATSDGRILAEGIELDVRPLPLPLMWMEQTAMYGHDKAYTVGVIETVEIVGQELHLSGYLLNSEKAGEAEEQIRHGVSNPSVDLANAEYTWVDDKGEEVEDPFEYWYETGEDPFLNITKAEFIGTTLCAMPAFGTLSVTLGARETREAALVASAAAKFVPRTYEAELFENPKLAGPTPITMDPKTGRIFGHIACWGTSHRSVQGEMVPRNGSDYDEFHTSPPVLLNDGTRLPVGRLTVGTGHADTALNAGPALAHYDNTGTCFALVRAGEDRFGIWFSGVAAPGVSREQLEQGLSAPLSGDWRDFGRGLKLVAALSVNTPAFPVRGRTDYRGRDVALVASFSPHPSKSRRIEGGRRSGLTKQDVADIVAEAFTQADARARKAAKAAAAVERAKAAVSL